MPVQRVLANPTYFALKQIKLDYSVATNCFLDLFVSRYLLVHFLSRVSARVNCLLPYRDAGDKVNLLGCESSLRAT